MCFFGKDATRCRLTATRSDSGFVELLSPRGGGDKKSSTAGLNREHIIKRLFPPASSKPPDLNDHRPVALTPFLVIPVSPDPHQYAFRAQSSHTSKITTPSSECCSDWQSHLLHSSFKPQRPPGLCAQPPPVLTAHP